MVIEEISLSEVVEQAIRKHAEETYPYECCGILFRASLTDDSGNDPSGGEKPEDEIIRAVPLNNNRDIEDSRKHFSTDPMEILRVEREYEEQGFEIAGFYHSHPDCPAVPSEEDEREMIPGMLYLIVSVKKGTCREFRVWSLK
ncbi:MAG: M67 family metallopeptidase [Eubacterium sp.]|nr:M67 family metallopeptidase [Eubacterium sp.]